MSPRYSTRTPSRAQTLAEMGMTSSRTKQKPEPSVMLRPTTQAKRLVDMYEEMFPPTVRRHLSKSSTQHILHSTPLNRENNKSKGVFLKPTLMDSTQNTNKRPTAAQPNHHAYDLRNRPTISDSSNKIFTENIHKFTQYRNVNVSFDVSICEETSPQGNSAEKSATAPSEIVQSDAVNSQFSDLLCDMLSKTEISSNNSNITQKIKEIRGKAQENIENAKKQMEFMSLIFDEISKNKMILSSSIESNEQIVEMTNDLLKLSDDNETVENPTKRNKLTSIPVSRRSIVKPSVYKFPQEGSANSIHVVKNIVSPFKNSEDKFLPPINVIQKNNVLHNENKTKILTHNVKNSAAKENLSPFPKKTFSPKKIVSSPRSDQRKLKNNNLRTAVLKCNFESNIINTDEESPSKHSKSQLIFKSLKKSNKLLKTPVGKGKSKISSSSDVAFETPNTRSRNITSNNIKRQLESLYDS